jgi:hypothetical protein
MRGSRPVCPRCGEPTLRRASDRALFARLRRTFTRKRPHACVKCGWNGWIDVPPSSGHADTWTVECAPPDLEALDAVLAEPTAHASAAAVPNALPHVQRHDEPRNRDHRE